MSYILHFLTFVWLVITKGSRDIALTLYDDFNFQYMSLPRIGLGVGIIMVMASWIAQQFYELKFEYFPELVKLVIALAATYGIKKYVEKDKEVKKDG